MNCEMWPSLRLVNSKLLIVNCSYKVHGFRYEFKESSKTEIKESKKVQVEIFHLIKKNPQVPVTDEYQLK